jgi:hypothetical protein
LTPGLAKGGGTSGKFVTAGAAGSGEAACNGLVVIPSNGGPVFSLDVAHRLCLLILRQREMMLWKPVVRVLQVLAVGGQRAYSGPLKMKKAPRQISPKPMT